MFTKSTGVGLAAYATQPGGLFEKIGIRNGTFRWMTNKYGENEFDGSSYHQLHNLARFGLLMASGGSWKGEQLLDEEYVEAISQPTPRGVGGCPDYRRFFWHKPLGGVPKDAIITWGGGGQFVVTIPSLDLVVLSMFGGRLAKFVPPPDIASWPSNATEFMPRKGDILADTGNIRGGVGSTVGSNDPLCYGGSGWNWTFVEPVPMKTTTMGRGAQMPGGASCGGSGTKANFSANPPSDFLTTMVASVVAAIV
jgi:CubicO group peptidase (beta-lactamase class C family)